MKKEGQIIFSVVVPTYNRAALIQKTLSSLIAQNFSAYEIIVVDDGSTDNTEEVVKALASEKINYFKIPNSERAFARNYGASKASGDYLNFFDSDDIALPFHLETAEKTIAKYNSPPLFHLNYDVMSEGRVIRQGQESGDLIKGNYLSCNCVFLKKEVFNEVKFNPDRRLVFAEDWDLWLKLRARHEIIYNPVITSHLIQGDHRGVMNFSERAFDTSLGIFIKSLSADKKFMDKYGNDLSRIKAHMLSYGSLHAALTRQKKVSMRYLRKLIAFYPAELFTRRTLAIFKYLLS